MFYNLSKFSWKRLLVSGYQKARLWIAVTFCNFIFILTAFVIIVFCIPVSFFTWNFEHVQNGHCNRSCNEK